MQIKKILFALLVVFLLGITFNSAKAEENLYIDTIGVYTGMDRSYENGYIPVEENGKVRIVLPLMGGLGSELAVTPNLGNSALCPYVFANYNMTVTRDCNGVFVIDFCLEVLDNSAKGTYPIIFDVSTSEGTSGTFTIYTSLHGNSNGWDWIENHSTFIGIASKVIFWIAGIIIAGTFFYFNSYKKKKAAALFGFYTRYDILLTILQEQLSKCNEKTTPFALLYTKKAQSKNELHFPGASDKATIEMFLTVSNQLKDLLLSSDNNVYPKLKNKTDWYNNTLAVARFALMITDGIGVCTINENDENKKNAKPLYQQKWEELNNAIHDLLKDIKEVQY